MPIVNVKEQEEKAVGKLGMTNKLPRDRYTLRLIKAEFGISKSSQNPMVTNTWEIASPNEVVGLKGEKLIVAGTKFTQYLPTRANGDAEKTANAQKRFADEYKKCGMPLDSWDDEQPPLLSIGLLVDATCSSKESVDFKSDGKTPIKKADGTDQKRLEHRIEQITGVSSLAVNQAFA